MSCNEYEHIKMSRNGDNFCSKCGKKLKYVIEDIDYFYSERKNNSIFVFRQYKDHIPRTIAEFKIGDLRLREKDAIYLANMLVDILSKEVNVSLTKEEPLVKCSRCKYDRGYYSDSWCEKGQKQHDIQNFIKCGEYQEMGND